MTRGLGEERAKRVVVGSMKERWGRRACCRFGVEGAVEVDASRRKRGAERTGGGEGGSSSTAESSSSSSSSDSASAVSAQYIPGPALSSSLLNTFFSTAIALDLPPSFLNGFNDESRCRTPLVHPPILPRVRPPSEAASVPLGTSAKGLGGPARLVVVRSGQGVVRRLPKLGGRVETLALDWTRERSRGGWKEEVEVMRWRGRRGVVGLGGAGRMEVREEVEGAAEVVGVEEVMGLATGKSDSRPASDECCVPGGEGRGVSGGEGYSAAEAKWNLEGFEPKTTKEGVTVEAYEVLIAQGRADELPRERRPLGRIVMLDDASSPSRSSLSSLALPLPLPLRSRFSSFSRQMSTSASRVGDVDSSLSTTTGEGPSLRRFESFHAVSGSTF